MSSYTEMKNQVALGRYHIGRASLNQTIAGRHDPCRDMIDLTRQSVV
jgi:hypothetical protein